MIKMTTQNLPVIIQVLRKSYFMTEEIGRMRYIYTNARASVSYFS